MGGRVVNRKGQNISVLRDVCTLAGTDETWQNLLPKMIPNYSCDEYPIE